MFNCTSKLFTLLFIVSTGICSGYSEAVGIVIPASYFEVNDAFISESINSPSSNQLDDKDISGQNPISSRKAEKDKRENGDLPDLFYSKTEFKTNQSFQKKSFKSKSTPLDFLNVDPYIVTFSSIHYRPPFIFSDIKTLEHSYRC